MTIEDLQTQLAAAQATITALSQENQKLKESMACTPETTNKEGASQPLRADNFSKEKNDATTR